MNVCLLFVVLCVRWLWLFCGYRSLLVLLFLLFLFGVCGFRCVACGISLFVGCVFAVVR